MTHAVAWSALPQTLQHINELCTADRSSTAPSADAHCLICQDTSMLMKRILYCAGFKLVYRRTTGEESVPTGYSMAFGAVSGLLAATATFPVETVR